MYLTYETMNVLRGIRAYYSILLLLRHFFTEELVNQYYLQINNQTIHACRECVYNDNILNGIGKSQLPGKHYVQQKSTCNADSLCAFRQQRLQSDQSTLRLSML